MGTKKWDKVEEEEIELVRKERSDGVNDVELNGESDPSIPTMYME